MKIFVPIIVLLLCCSEVFGRIGETEAEINTRYGAPTGTLVQGNVRMKEYSYKGFSVIVGFLKGVSSVETYQKRDAVPMSDGEIQGLLDANGGGIRWHQPITRGYDVFYNEKTRFADYNSLTCKLSICAPESLKRIVADNNAADAQKMKGF